MKKLTVRHVEKQSYLSYITRSVQCLNSAKESLKSRAFDACAICSVHCVISAVDALCAYYLLERNAGPRHEDAAELLTRIKGVDEEALLRIKNKFLRIIKDKNMAEYEERPVKPKEAEKLCADAAAVLEYAKKMLPA